MEYSINSFKSENFNEIVNNIPLETEILNIYKLNIPKDGVISNLPCNIKEVNIWGEIAFFKRANSSKKIYNKNLNYQLKKMFTKRPLNCKFYISNEDDPDTAIYTYAN